MMSASLSYARRKGVTERFRKYSNGETRSFISQIPLEKQGFTCWMSRKTASPLPCICIWRNS